MSTTTMTPEPIKKRGRPSKVVEEPAEEVAKTTTRKASTKAAIAAKGTRAKGDDDVVVVKKATKAAKTVSKKKTELKPTKSTPVATSSSKILQQVAAKGTLKLGSTAKPSSPPSPPTSKPPPSSRPPSSTPTPPTPPTPSAPHQPRMTTIPLPSKTPNPIIPNTRSPPPQSIPHTPKPKPTPIPIAIPTPNSPPIPLQRPTYEYDGRLPPKYKPAARRVTAIIVGIPILLVTSWELWRRWDGQIRHTFKFREVERPKKNLLENPAASNLSNTGSDSVTGKPA